MLRIATISLLMQLFFVTLAAAAGSDAQRIEQLEAQLADQQALFRQQFEQQQKMLEAMAAQMQNMAVELESLKAGTEPAAIAGAAPAPAAGEQVAAEPSPKRVVDGTALGWYGHIQLDAIYDVKRVAPDYESAFRPSTIPTQSGEFGSDGNTNISVKQTTLGFRGATDTPLGVVKTWFEFDLFGTGGDAGDTTFDFRHGWVEIGGLGFGQTNSNFMDISIFPNVIDWWGPSGMVFNRNAQVRYTWGLGESELAVALEKSNGSFNTGIFGEISPEFGAAANVKTPLPDLTAHYRSVHDWGHVQLAGVLRKLEFETNGTPGNDPSGDETGWGLNLTSVINSVGRDQLKLGIVYGEGIASYMNDGGVNIAPQNFSPEAVPVWAFSSYYDHYWSERWSSSIGVSVNDADPRNQQAAGEFDRAIYASTNLLYRPVPDMLMGLELLFGENEDVAGRTGRDYRAQFSLKHSFTDLSW